MFQDRPERPVDVRLPDGSLLSRSDLPVPPVRRWVARRKAVVAQAVVHGLIGRSEALRRYELSERELDGWIIRHDQMGVEGLKICSLQRG